MKAHFEFLAFSVLALCVHAAGFAVTPDRGEDSSGAQGEYLLSIQGASEQIEQLVEDWTQEPEIADTVPQFQMVEPILETATDGVAPLTVLPSPNAPVQIQAPETAPEDLDSSPLPKVSTQPAERPKPKTKAHPKKKPKAKPKRKVKEKQKPRKKKAIAKPSKRNTASSAGQKKQKAAGQGGRTSAGSSGKSKPKTGNSAKAAKALGVWGAQVRRSIERRKRSVRGLKRRARVVVSVTVASNGQVLSYRISKSSGNKKADSAALKAVNSAGRMPKAVKGVAARKHTFRVPMVFNP